MNEMSGPRLPPKSPRMDNSTVLPGIQSNLKGSDHHTRDEYEHKHGQVRQSHEVDDIRGDGMKEDGVVFHPLGKQIREGYPPTHANSHSHQYRDDHGHSHKQEQTPSPPLPLKTAHHNHQQSPNDQGSGTPRFNIHPPTPPTPTDDSIPLRPGHLNYKTINPNSVDVEPGLDLERYSNNVSNMAGDINGGAVRYAGERDTRGGGPGSNGDSGTREGAFGREGPGREQEDGGGGGGVMNRFKTSFLNKNRIPMSKTWAKKSYIEELESIAPSSPTSPTRSNWTGPSIPVTTITRDLEGQGEIRQKHVRDLPRAKSVYASPIALAQFRALPPMNAQGEIMSAPR